MEAVGGEELFEAGPSHAALYRTPAEEDQVVRVPQQGWFVLIPTVERVEDHV